MMDDTSPQTGRSPWLHRIALLTAFLTFLMIFMGGLVTSHHAGMSVPNWPNSYGYNMFLFPPRFWVGGIFYEHTHRLMGAVVGMCSIVLVIAAWILEKRRWVRWLAAGVLAMVILQGVLGGLRVVLVQLDLAIVHACVAQAFFCLTVLMAIVTSRWWFRKSKGSAGRGIVALAIACVILIYCQLVVGATMRHFDAGLAIPDLPFAYGKLLPPTTSAELDAINHERAWKMDLPPVTLGQIWLHFAHRIGALIVTGGVVMLVISILWTFRRNGDLILPAWFLSVLLIAQLSLGVLTVYLRKPADIASAHVAVGALVLVTAFIIAVRAIRLYSLGQRTSGNVREELARDQHHSGLHVVPG